MGNRSSPWNDTLRPVSRCTALAPTTPPAIFETRSISRSSRGSCGSAASSALASNSAVRADRRAAFANHVMAPQPNVLVGALHGGAVVRSVDGADQVQLVRGVGRDVHQALGLAAGRFIPADHVEVYDGARRLDRAQRMRDVVVRAEQSAFF